MERISGVADVFPIIVSEVLMDKDRDYMQESVELFGRIKTKNVDMESKSTLKIYVFADHMSITDGTYFQNEVELTGFIGRRTPMYRVTPRDKQISD